MLAGFYAAAIVRGEEPVPVPRPTALGSLVHYITHADPRTFNPPTSPSTFLSPWKRSCARKSATKRSAIASCATRPCGIRRMVGRNSPPAAELRPLIPRNSVVRWACSRKVPHDSHLRRRLRLACHSTHQGVSLQAIHLGTYLKLSLVAIITEGVGGNSFRSSSHSFGSNGHAPTGHSPFPVTPGWPGSGWPTWLTPGVLAAIGAAVVVMILLSIVIFYLITRLRFAYFHCLTTNTKLIHTGWGLYGGRPCAFSGSILRWD